MSSSSPTSHRAARARRNEPKRRGAVVWQRRVACLTRQRPSPSCRTGAAAPACVEPAPSPVKSSRTMWTRQVSPPTRVRPAPPLLLVWNRRPRRPRVRGRCGHGRYPRLPVLRPAPSLLLVWNRRPRRSGSRARSGPGICPGPLLGHPRLGHNSPIQRQRRVTYQPWLKAKETGPPKVPQG